MTEQTGGDPPIEVVGNPKIKFPGEQPLPEVVDIHQPPSEEFRDSSDVKEPEIVVISEPGRAATGLRLRKRGRATAALQRIGETLPVWWEDLDGLSFANRALAWFESHLGDSGVKVGKTMSTMATDSDGKSTAITMVQALFSSEEGTRWLWICPELLATLHCVRIFRPASEGLLASLRSRARLWAKEIGLSVFDLSRSLAGTLVLATLPLPDEVVAVGALRGSANQWGQDVLGALSAGRVKATSRGSSWWDVLRPSLRFGNGLKGQVLGGKGCRPINMAT